MRNVGERRQETGALRALGFRKSMVLRSFLIELSFIALTGIAMGVALGVALSYDLYLRFFANQAAFVIPWERLLLLGGIAFLGAVLATASPAIRASRMPPAEAPRSGVPEARNPSDSNARRRAFISRGLLRSPRGRVDAGRRHRGRGNGAEPRPRVFRNRGPRGDCGSRREGWRPRVEPVQRFVLHGSDAPAAGRTRCGERVRPDAAPRESRA